MENRIYLKKKGKHDFEDCTDKIDSIVQKNEFWEIVFKISAIKYRFPFNSVRLMTETVEKEEDKDFGVYEYDKDKSEADNILQYLVQFCNSQAELMYEKNTNEEDDETITPFLMVGNALKELDYQGTGSALEAYLSRSVKVCTDDLPRIFPFGCNGSQKKAVEEALTHQVSIIEGPPGTGKTQTILNLVANMVMRNKSVAIVSNNNAAVANVAEKLTKFEFQWLCARLGRSELREQFFKKKEDAINTSEDWILERPYILKKKINETSEIVDKFFKNQIDLQQKRNCLSAVKHEKDVYCKEHVDCIEEIKAVRDEYFTRNTSLENLLEFRDFVVDNFSIIKWYQLRKRYIFWKAGIRHPNDFLRKKENVLYAINLQIYDISIAELEEEIIETEKWINNHKTKVEEYISDSMTYFKHILRETFAKLYVMPFTIDNYKSRMSEFVQRYPVVLSSTFSLKSSTEKGFRYDYVIIDEASQTNIPAAALCFGIAKNVVVVGDSRQLKHIVDTNTIQLADNMKKGYDAVEESMLTSCKNVFRKTVPVTMLREHYRCHPLIIEYCNRRFYNNDMVIMSCDDGEFPFLMIDVADNKLGYYGSSAYNERQALETIDIINNEDVRSFVEAEIGVVAPYRAHANRIEEMLNKGSLVEVDTVHKFQGREKDVIIYNSVMGKISPFNDDPHLINVAVSRAKSKFIVVAPMSLGQGDSNLASLINFIQYQDPDCKFTKKSKRSSVFDVLYGAAADLEALNEKRLKRESPAETVFRMLLTKILSDADSRLSWNFKQEYYLIDLMKAPRNNNMFTDEEWEYMIRGSRLDFLVYDTMLQDAIVAIEINGGHHYKGTSRRNDQLKAHILSLLGIPLVSFWTDSIEGREEEELRKVLNEAYLRRNQK